MKMSTELFATLQKSFNTLSKDSVDNYINAYETGKFPRSELVKDLQCRFCWDIIWSLGWYSDNFDAISKENLFDQHIYTALKKVMPTVTRRY